jgi:PadR family transcriptional regulator, regulatory protein PadR
MDIENVKSQMRKGFLEYCTLLILREKASYTSDIIEGLKSAHLIVVEGTLYPLLTRLKNDGLLSYEWVESTQGPPRKYYSLTEEGEACLENLTEAWQELSSAINNLNEGLESTEIVNPLNDGGKNTEAGNHSDEDQESSNTGDHSDDGQKTSEIKENLNE